MVSLEVVIQELFTKAVVNIFLVSIVIVLFVVRPERVVECEGFVLEDLAAGLGLGLSLVANTRLRCLEFCHLRVGVHLNKTFGLSLDLYTEQSD